MMLYRIEKVYQIILIIVIVSSSFHQGCVGNQSTIILGQNFTSNDCLKTLAKYILRDHKFETREQANFETGSLLNSIMTMTSYVSYWSNEHIIVLNESDSKFVFEHGFDKKFLIVQKDINYFKAIELLVGGWFKRRAKIGVLLTESNNITFVNSYYLDGTKLCTKHFYQKYTCNDTAKVAKHYLSKEDLKTLCRVTVGWIKGYPFVDNITRKVNPGIMVSFLRVYEEKRHLNVKFLKDNRQYKHEYLHNGSVYRLCRDLLAGKVDVGIGPLLMNSTDEIPVSYGPVFFKDIYYFTTRKRKKIESYHKLTIVFSVEVWKGLLVSFIAVVFAYFLLGLIIESQKLGFIAGVFHVYRMSLSSGVSILPVSVSLRLLFVYYSWFSIIIDSTYLGILSSVLTNAPYDFKETKIQNIMSEENVFNVNWLAERLLKLRFVALRSFPKFAHLSHVIRNESDEELLKRIAYAQKNLSFNLLSTLISHPYETSLVDYFEVPNAYQTLFVTFYIRNDFHLKDSLQFWSEEMIEKGFISKWMNDAVEQNRNASYIINERKDVIALKIEHFEVVFQLLGIGYALAVTALILEFVYKWLDHRLKLTQKIMFIFSLLKPPPVYD